ncbi:MAG: hypothetical protein GY820_30565, partial [Gammaproteobacteria bacterium]|nr:hypothetical protein [Gammaproteobacteria bacterium]
PPYHLFDTAHPPYHLFDTAESAVPSIWYGGWMRRTIFPQGGTSIRRTIFLNSRRNAPYHLFLEAEYWVF